MNPGPQLHRSLTFWAGLLTIAFTCFAWWASCRTRLTIGSQRAELRNEYSGLNISWTDLPQDTWYFHRHFYPDDPVTVQWVSDKFPQPILARSHQHQGVTPDGTMRAQLQWMINLFGPGCWTLFIPYWLILLTLTITWTFLLLTRARRRRRAFTAPAQRHSD